MIYIGAKAVAERLGLDGAAAFLRIRERLERDQDFPPPMPILRAPLKWRADAVDAWIEGQGLPGPAPITPAPGSNVVLMAEARR